MLHIAALARAPLSLVQAFTAGGLALTVPVAARAFGQRLERQPDPQRQAIQEAHKRYVDGLLIPFIGSLGVVGLATAFLLGNLRDERQAGLGLAIVLGCIVLVVANIPGAQSASDLIFIPLRFVVAWIAGYALRERSEQAEAAEMRAALAEREREAAEMRATLAEREREAAARIAVAEERTRIARELHDIVAHAMSVMVLQVGAVRHQLPHDLEEDREALGRVEQVGRTALAEMRRLLGAMRRDGDDVELGPQPGLDALDSLVEAVSRAGLSVHLHVGGEPFPFRERSTSPPIASCRRA